MRVAESKTTRSEGRVQSSSTPHGSPTTEVLPVRQAVFVVRVGLSKEAECYGIEGSLARAAGAARPCAAAVTARRI